MGLRLEEVEALLREGTRFTEEVPADELADGETLTVRPLTRGEVARVKSKAMTGQKVITAMKKDPGDRDPRPEGNVEVDLAAAGEAAEEAELMTIAFGLSVDGQKWTTKQVGLLPDKLADRLLHAVRRLTDSEDLMEGMSSFRRDEGS